jgi:hypothetical protein
MLREATNPPAAVNVLDVSSESMAAFQVFLYGRFWVFTEAEERNMPKNSTPATQQYERIVALCRQSEPMCETWLLSDRESSYLKLRMMSGSTLVYESHHLQVGELEKMSADELWSLLEHLSSRRIRRPAA